MEVTKEEDDSGDASSFCTNESFVEGKSIRTNSE